MIYIPMLYDISVLLKPVSWHVCMGIHQTYPANTIADCDKAYKSMIFNNLKTANPDPGG